MKLAHFTKGDGALREKAGDLRNLPTASIMGKNKSTAGNKRVVNLKSGSNARETGKSTAKNIKSVNGEQKGGEGLREPGNQRLTEGLLIKAELRRNLKRPR